MKIKRDRVVLNFRETDRECKGIISGQYPHVVGDKIYWQLKKPSEVAYAIKEGEAYKKPDNNVILSKSLAAQNFRVFLDTRPDISDDERYKAIGGYHVGRSAIKVKNPSLEQIRKSPLHIEIEDCPISADLEIVQLPDQVWPDETRLVFKDDFLHPRHANGFYIFKSFDGIKWELYHDNPVMSVFSGIEGLQMASDNMPSIFYDHSIDEYVAYLRCNIKLGVRHVFYTKSKDLINWDEPQLIQKSPKFDFEHENLYYMGAYPLPNSEKYISFTPHFRNDILSSDGSNRRYYDTKTLIMISDDRLNWKVVDEIFFDNSNGHMTQRHVVSFTEEGGVYALYVNEGFMTYDTKLVRYVIEKKELDKLVL